MRRTLGMAALALALTACSVDEEEPPVVGVDESTGATTREYPPFSEVDPYTSLYFVTLEDNGLAESIGEELLYTVGVQACMNLDRGDSIDQELARLTAIASIGDHGGTILGAAVTDLCPQHGDAVEQYLATHQ